MAILSKYNLDRYQYGVDIRKRQQLYGMSGKILYEGKWLTKGNKTVIIVEMNQAITEREAEFYLKVNNHQNIIRTFGYVDSTPDLTIFIQEYARFNDLGSVLLDNQVRLSPTILLQMFIQIADAMSYVAQQRIVHGDLGCRNVLVFNVDENDPKNNVVKLTDFGLARWMDRPLADESNEVIPIRFCAPEILRNKRHESFSEKSDVYSFAVLIWEALSNGEMPYSSEANDEVVTSKKLAYEKLPFPNVCNNQLWTLINTCWHRSPDQRPSFDEIKEKLSNINIIDVPADLITQTSHREQLVCKYQLDRDVRIGRKINRGSPAIYEAEWLSNDRGPIIIIEKNDIPFEHEQLFYTVFEKNKHIVRTYGYVGNDHGTAMILQERAPLGNLQNLLTSGQFRPSIAVLIEIFKQIIDVMGDVVGAGLVHGDLRCENILVFQKHPTDPKQNLVKLCNFSLAHKNDPTVEDNRRLNISVRYCALEILRSVGRSNYSELADVYSMGVLMWQALSGGKLPYESSITQAEVRQRKLNKESLQRPSNVQSDLWKIITECWYNEPICRYEFEGMKTLLSRVTPPPDRTVVCQWCRREIRELDMTDHQNSCKEPQASSGTSRTKGRTNPTFESEEEPNTTSQPKRTRHESPRRDTSHHQTSQPTVVQERTPHRPNSTTIVRDAVKYTSCPYCAEQVVDIDGHQNMCSVARQFANTNTPGTSSANNQRNLPVPATSNQPRRPSHPNPNQISPTQPITSRKRKQKSFWGRFCPCFGS